MIIELTLFTGRTKEQKGDAIKAITSRLGASLGIAPTDVFIVINVEKSWVKLITGIITQI